MKLFAVSVLLAAVAVSSAAQASDVVLTMNSYGPIKVGMPVAEVHQLLQKLGRKNLPKPRKAAKKGCDYYQASPELSFMLEDGKVVRIETTEKNVVTPSGIRVGSSTDKVRRALGSRVEDNPQRDTERPTTARTIVLVSGDQQHAIRVDTDEAVSEIFTGAAHAIRYIEGCA